MKKKGEKLGKFIQEPISKFIHQENSGGILLFGCFIIALLITNSYLQTRYAQFWKTSIGFHVGDFSFSLHLVEWVNNGLMALFFFVIGLELKREFIAGELSVFSKALLPMAGALGGMLFPALIYSAINWGSPTQSGWGIPMATDIAFSLSILMLAGSRVPSSLKIFLSALAVADDLGAVIVIAIFYTPAIHLIPLFIAIGLLLIMVAGNRIGIRITTFYLILGLLVWFALLFSGIHATIAGVLSAFTIPARTRISENDYIKKLRILTARIKEEEPNNSPLLTQGQHHIIKRIKKVSIDADTPLQKLEDKLHPWVIFFIIPIFTLSNAGIPLRDNFLELLTSKVSLGAGLGLIIGKCSGILFAVFLLVSLKWAELPEGASWKDMIGVAMLGGIGFTMSLFINTLAFRTEQPQIEAQIGILAASVISGVIGIFILKSSRRKA